MSFRHFAGNIVSKFDNSMFVKNISYFKIYMIILLLNDTGKNKIAGHKISSDAFVWIVGW